MKWTIGRRVFNYVKQLSIPDSRISVCYFGQSQTFEMQEGVVLKQENNSMGE
jgi:hypothetical protein